MMAFTSCGTYCHLAICEETFISHNTQHKTDYLKNCEKTVAATVDFCQTKKSRPEAESKNDGKVVILWQKINAHPFNMSSKSMSCSLFDKMKLMIFTTINHKDRKFGTS